METLKVGEVRSVFLTQKGLPRKEILLTVEDVYKACGVPFSENRYEFLYQKRLGSVVMTSLKRYFTRHHIKFIAPKIGTKVHYGFSNDPELNENYVCRMEKSYTSHKIAYDTAKQLTEGQLELGVSI